MNPHVVKRLSDGKLFQIRCREVPVGNDGDFNIVWEFWKNGKWIENKETCSQKYTFHVPEKEKCGIQTFLNF